MLGNVQEFILLTVGVTVWGWFSGGGFVLSALLMLQTVWTISCDCLTQDGIWVVNGTNRSLSSSLGAEGISGTLMRSYIGG